MAYTNVLIKKPFEELCDLSTDLNQLKRKQLQFYSSHRWLAYKDGQLETSEYDHECICACKRYNRHSSVSPRLFRLNFD